MCRAIRVLCVAADADALAALKRATVAAEWELARGAVSPDDALAQLEQERPHVLVVFGPFEELVRRARERSPGIRVIADRDLPGASAVVASMEEVRAAIKGRPRPGGPVT